jgi:hypothetical protein
MNVISSWYFSISELKMGLVGRACALVYLGKFYFRLEKGIKNIISS